MGSQRWRFGDSSDSLDSWSQGSHGSCESRAQQKMGFKDICWIHEEMNGGALKFIFGGRKLHYRVFGILPLRKTRSSRPNTSKFQSCELNKKGSKKLLRNFMYSKLASGGKQRK